MAGRGQAIESRRSAAPAATTQERKASWPSSIPRAEVQLVLGDGRGNFTLGNHFAAPGSSFRLGDLDRDGNVDIALTGNGVTLVFGTGGGNFAAPISLDSTSVYQALEIADINGDQIPDLVVVGSSLAVFRGPVI